MNRTSRACCVGAVAAFTTASLAHAGFLHTWFTPSVYTGVSDSPFDVKQPLFCVEDFENGLMDLPGVTGDGQILSPGGNIDSVDADDGEVDGSGTGGHSYFRGDGQITITFDPMRANGLPSEVGIVWTDGGFGATVMFEALGPTGLPLGDIGPYAHADSSNNGETAEDRFYGIANEAGISRIRITNSNGGIEVDHLQLNHCLVCGDFSFDGEITVADALGVLQTAVGHYFCQPCLCDVNDSTTTTVSDALVVLQRAIGLSPPMNCPSCPPTRF